MADELIKYVSADPIRVTSVEPRPQQGLRTVLFSKNSLLAIGLKHVLEGAGISVSGIATDETSLCRFLADGLCSLAVVDGNSPTEQIAETIRSVKGQYPQIQVMVIADAFDLRFVQMGLDAGAHGFCVSACSHDVLIKSIELAALGETILPTTLVREILSAAPQRQERATENDLADPKSLNLHAQRLSAREAEILTCLTKGASNKVIARQLDVAEATVKVHIKAILRKIGVVNRTQAAMWAAERLTTRGGASSTTSLDG